MVKKVLIFGTFDILHPGHLFVFKEARKYGEVHAVVALDETVVHVKGKQPLHSLNERIRQLEACGIHAHAGDAHDRLKVFKAVKPDYVLLGYDQVFYVTELKAHIFSQHLQTVIIDLPAFHQHLFQSRKIRRVLEDTSAGFLLIDKPVGEPSFFTVMGLRKLTGLKQVGFAGTLDPIASGLLICGVGKATTLLDWWHLFPKTYETEVRLGVVSDTYDATGRVEKQSDMQPKAEDLTKALISLQGSQSQQPPMFSAKKVGGRKLYELAREGKIVERRAHEVEVYLVELLMYSYPMLRFRVRCSSGTYVRSLVHELGERLGTGAIMTGLRRTAIGPCRVEDAMALPKLSSETWQFSKHPVLEVRDALATHLFPNL